MMKWFSFVEWNLPSGEDCGVRSPFVSMADARQLFIYSEEMILWKYEVGRVIFQVIIIMCARREICPSLSPRIYWASYVVMLVDREILILTSRRRGCHNYWYWFVQLLNEHNLWLWYWLSKYSGIHNPVLNAVKIMKVSAAHKRPIAQLFASLMRRNVTHPERTITAVPFPQPALFKTVTTMEIFAPFIALVYVTKAKSCVQDRPTIMDAKNLTSASLCLKNCGVTM